jgi:hypothetical protein
MSATTHPKGMVESNTKGMSATDVSYYPPERYDESDTKGMAATDVSYYPPERYDGE